MHMNCFSVLTTEYLFHTIKNNPRWRQIQKSTLPFIDIQKHLFII